MTTTYIGSLPEKKFIPNIVVKLKGQYFSIHPPDSGLVIPAANQGMVSALNVNPTSIDPFRSTATINNYSFTLLDKNGVISKMFNNDPKFFQGEIVEIYLGRVGKDATEFMDFADYYQLPINYINKVTKSYSSYAFQAIEARDRLASGKFQTQTKLAVDILDITTVITLQSVVGFPANGFIQIENEFISYTGIIGNDLQACVRGEVDSVPVDHALGTDVFIISVVETNPIDMILQLLISGGGGGPYDVLADGAGIDQSLVDITQFLQVRDEFFSAYTFKLVIGGLDSLKSFIETELLFPLGVRLRSNNNSKIGLALIDRTIFEIDISTIDHDELTANPEFIVDITKIINQVRIFWDWDDGLQNFQKTSEYTDPDSIADFDTTDFFEISIKGVRETLGGQAIVDDIAALFLNRFSYPRPQIAVNTHMSSSQLNLGDKVDLFTVLLPNDLGDLNFGSTLEIVSKSINHTTGDVKFQLSFTSFSGIRQCYLAPSDTITTFSSQKIVNIGAGRGDNYRAGWKIRLYDNVARDYASLQINEIASVIGDLITFVDPWSTTLVNGQFRIMFADYDDVTTQQKRFCFASAGTNPFADGTNPYQISFG